jgi:hypothetical protein
MQSEETFERFSTSTRATDAVSGTVDTRSSPLMAGTGAFVNGSIFIEMVPPVAMRRTNCCAGLNSGVHSLESTRDAEGCVWTQG